MNNDKLKQQICDALAAWIRQRPSLEFGNYGDVSSYRSEARSIARDKRDAETLLAAVRNNSAITAEMILDAAKHSFSGRMEIKVSKHWLVKDGDKTVVSDVALDYTTGAYRPTEYRKAAAAVLAGVLWAHMRDNMPEPTKFYGTNGDWYINKEEGKLPTTHSAGDWLRNRFRKEFGSKLQRRWFN